MVVACGFQFLGGESNKSLEDSFQISKLSSKRAVRRLATTVVQCEAPVIDSKKSSEQHTQHPSNWQAHGCCLWTSIPWWRVKQVPIGKLSHFKVIIKKSIERSCNNSGTM
jgi:hypothetical protein